MGGHIHLLRHAEGTHSLFNTITIPDAPLSQRGFDQAKELGRMFVSEHSNTTGAVISSPLCRSSALGVDNGVMLTLDANLQEPFDAPCNTGTPKSRLAARFPRQEAEINGLDSNWHTDSERKKEILKMLDQTLDSLKDEPRANNVVVVTHQGILERLAPGTTFPAGQWRTFNLVRNANGELTLQ
ncbi:histidine phosphatase superfamily [Aspergillus crustosus]